MIERAVKLIGSQRIAGADPRVRKPVDMPLNLARIAAHKLLHRRNGILKPLPFFRSRIRDHADDSVLGAALGSRLEASGVDAMFRHRHHLSETAAELTPQP